jgi:hypothetical protein
VIEHSVEDARARATLAVTREWLQRVPLTRVGHPHEKDVERLLTTRSITCGLTVAELKLARCLSSAFMKRV